MPMLTRFRRWALAAILLAGASVAVQAQQSMVTYVGDAGRDRFNGLLRLSDGTVLVAGRSQSLGWVPGSVPVTTLTIPQVPSAVNDSVLGINSRDTTNSIAYVLHMTADLTNILSVVRFPSGSVWDVTRIRTNTVPGATTGGIYISGRRINPKQRGTPQGNSSYEGYYIAKLNNNFLGGSPTGLDWSYDLRGQIIRNNTSAYPYYGAGSDAGVWYQQPWDVSADGKIYAVIGREFSDDWCQIIKLRPQVVNGNMQMVSDSASHMPYHQVKISGSGNAAQDLIFREIRKRNVHIGDSVTVNILTVPTKVRIDSIVSSGVLLKTNRSGTNMRSYLDADANLLLNDENGNAGRKGKYPDDYYYAAPCTTGCNNNGPGYSGYSLGLNGNNTATQRVVSVSVDRRTGDVYYGSSTWSRHANSYPAQDFEPAIICMQPDGEVKWWARGYQEDTSGSKALQFIDQVEIDYNNNHLVVLARSIGDATKNFWHGNQINASPGANGFQNMITGTTGERDVADVRWIGKYRLSDGVILRSTYVGEVRKDAVTGSVSADPNLDGWHDPNSGNPALATTKINKMSILADGSILVAGISDGRIITTTNAYQKSLKASTTSATEPGTNSFVRVYKPDLSGISYSTLLSNVWDPVTGSGGGTVELMDVIPGPTNDFLQVVGYHKAATTAPAVADGGPVPTINVPSWGARGPQGESALIASIYTNCTSGLPAQPDTIIGSSAGCVGTTNTFVVSQVPGATHYVWALPGTNYSGVSYNDTIRITGLAGAGGTLRVVAVNACGVSPAQYLVLSAPQQTARPTALALIPGTTGSATVHCQNTTRWYRIAAAASNATSYRWVMPNSGWVPVGAQPGDTVFVSTTDSIQIFLADTTTRSGFIRVRAVGLCGPSTAFARAFTIGRTVATPDSIRRPNNTQPEMCIGSNRTYTATGVTGATSYIWSLPTGYTAPNLTTTTNSIVITANAGAVGGVVSVQAVSPCGPGRAKTLVLPAPFETPQPRTIQDNPATTTVSVTRQPGATYQWRRGNNNIPNATDTSYVYGSTSGNYFVVITSCGTSLTVGPIVSLNDKLTANAVSLAPNPTTGKLTLTVSGGVEERTAVRILDVMGREVKTLLITKVDGVATSDLDITNLAAGVYTAEIQNGSEKVQKRISKQ